MSETILPHELPYALGRAPETMRVLSLDCFDTLLWRDCYAPTDVFAALPKLSTRQRAVAETRARKAEATLRRRSEVGLNAIYDHAMPNGAKTSKEKAISEELRAEARSCFAFAPTVQLMRAAKAGGAKVIIVSDTYLDSKQLEWLIRLAAGDEVASLIDHVFASSQEGLSKSQGLFAKALKTMKAKPFEVFHIGDNRTADYLGARAFGIPALHLEQFGEATKQRLRLERSCQKLIGDCHSGASGLMLHRPLIAIDEPQIEDPAELLGFSVLGPVFNGFDQWLRFQSIELEQKRGGTVHWLFMLRDGHLPHLINQAAGEVSSTSRVEISRFTAIAASLTTREDYQKHFALEFGLNPSTLARQMLFEEKEIDQICKEDGKELDMVEASERLRAELRKGQREKITIRRSRARAERLIQHVRATVDPKPGDTLMLVDLGYNGSAQDRIDHLLANAFDCHVAGRYLLLREMANTGLDKKGMIDAHHFDAELLEALCGNVAVIEQLATCEMGSVVDYTPDGQPIRKQSSVKGAQSDVRDRVQDGAVRFAQSAAQMPLVRAGNSHHRRGWREAALSTLFRFMFLPQQNELEVLKSFQHDVNLGSERMVPLFDEEHAREGIRRRGLFYMKGSERMFLPAELANEDMSTRLSLIAQMRFGLGLSYSDNVGRSFSIPVIYLNKEDSVKTTIAAVPTHDGFCTARLPIVAGASGVAVQFGEALEWFEMAGICLTSVGSLQGEAENDSAPVELSARFDRMSEPTPNLFEATDPAAFALINPPPQGDEDGAQMIEITFRPIRYREAIPTAAAPIVSTQQEAAA